MPHSISLENWWWGALSYACCHLLHVGVWRVIRVRRELLMLLACFYLPLAADLTFLTPPAALLHALLAANYIAVYPALQASSPTLRMLVLLFRRREGMTETDLLHFLSAERLMGERLKDLERAGLVIEDSGHLRLSRRGGWLASFFVGYRRFLGLPMGAG